MVQPLNSVLESIEIQKCLTHGLSFAISGEAKRQVITQHVDRDRRKHKKQGNPDTPV
jgi:hypothetical protein